MFKFLLVVMGVVAASNGQAVESQYNCYRVDYENYATAIYQNQVGPVESAVKLFNSSLPYGPENYLPASAFQGLAELSKNAVDCDVYFAPVVDGVPRILSPGALASLAG